LGGKYLNELFSLGFIKLYNSGDASYLAIGAATVETQNPHDDDVINRPVLLILLENEDKGKC
jgi:hypothetical protein